MKLTVSSTDLENRIKDALAKYEQEYVGLLELYGKKLTEYQAYIVRQAKKAKEGKPIGQLKYPPAQPSNVTHNLKKHLNGLKMHELEEIELTSDELNDITSGIERLRDNVEEVTLSMNSVSYVD